MLELDNRIEDLQYDLAESGETSSMTHVDDDGQASEAGGFMSESICGKLPSPKMRKRVAHSKIVISLPQQVP